MLLHSVSNYAPRMRLPASQWDSGSFASKGDTAYRTIAYANWPPESHHQIGSMVQVSIDLAIDAALASNLMGTFSSTDANVEPLHVRKTIYPPAPFIGIFLEQDLTPVESWASLYISIINRVL